MKQRRILYLPVLFAVLSLSGLAWKKINLYTTNQTKALAQSTAERAYPWWGNGSPNPIGLGEMLRRNLEVQMEIQEGAFPSDQTPQGYSSGWRKLAANNPFLLQQAISAYGPVFIKEYEHQLTAQHDSLKRQDSEWRTRGARLTLNPAVIEQEYRSLRFMLDSTWTLDSFKLHRIQQWQEWQRDSVEFEANLKAFSLKTYWQQQRTVINKYKRLFNELALLSDTELNRYIKAIGTEQTSHGTGVGATEVHAWLLQKGFIQKMPQPDKYGYWDREAWHFSKYPVDALFLTARITRDFPNWTPRNFIWEMQKAIRKIEAVIPPKWFEMPSC